MSLKEEAVEYLLECKDAGEIVHRLNNIPDHLLDHNICLVAVRRNGYSLLLVPNHLKSRKICLEAVKTNKCALIFVPKKLVDYNMYLSTGVPFSYNVRFVEPYTEALVDNKYLQLLINTL